MANIQKLLDIMVALRDPITGCPWDREQDFRSIVAYTIEEAYEVADAIYRKDIQALRDELGDLLLQVVFHARMAQEMGEFEFDDVVDAIADKLVRRHPHVFGAEKITSAAEQRVAWESLKAQEQHRNAGGHKRILGDIALSLPALVRAAKLGRRAAGVGFDWSDLAGVIAKVREEIGEVESALSGDPEQVAEEIGDLLFAVSNLARHAEVDPEDALRQANQKFERRFDQLEQRVRDSGRQWSSFSPVELDGLWNAIKGPG